MSSTPPPRRFAPTPIEETTRSSRQPEATNNDNKKPARRFAPEPIEESTRSSKDAREHVEEKSKPRRFIPELVEHDTTSPHHMDSSSEVGDKPKPRRFIPQLADETHSSSEHKQQEEKPHVKFKPEVISTTYGSNRNPKRSHDSDSSSAMDADDKAPRKFAPILLDTSRRSRKAGDHKPAVSQSDKTEYAYHLHHTEHWKRVNEERAGPSALPEPAIAAAKAERDDDELADNLPQLRVPCLPDGSSAKPQPYRRPSRTRSFHPSDLGTIESSESERESNPSPLSTSPARDGSPITASESSFEYFKHATRIRESVDENFTHYLMDLERRKARKRLEEQALAAYPNADFSYEAPNHYINNDDESEEAEIEDRPVTWEGNEDDLFEIKRPHRDSTVPWEQLEMQKHAEELQQERNANKITAKPTEPSSSPWWKPGEFGVKPNAEPNSELKAMQERARPPMLGSDIVFPRCPSPEPARFDVTQGSAVLRHQVGDGAGAAEGERQGSQEEAGLWHGPSPNSSPVTATKSRANSVKSTQSKGLWGGFCVSNGDDDTTTSFGLAPPAGPTGLMTPAVEQSNPFDLAFTSEPSAPGLTTPQTLQTPPAPKGKEPDFANLNSILAADRDFDAQLDADYPDSFITQVYNYLSLGYPALARPFDGELSKISRIPLADLRQDDVTAKKRPKGYIRLGGDFEGGGGDGVKEVDCIRWRALRLYVREWARQERGMVKWDVDGGNGNWGTGARRGSWAF
ncbi:uncharacterized protein LTR77_001487 [Saxophila tyrrhenica]|uniref:Uncharacterized protein n=1 Tax=Saxophila tyrrhenica TaxID=1690608 RepID=A0AAV9PM84_9PEZI|nr:hypothetical protein LTR77_001487 [Saxophila tyrrhenica]